jgi:hypothetical protein
MPRRRRSRRTSANLWAPVVAVAVAALLVGAAPLVVGLRHRRPTQAPDPGAYAPEPLTGDPTSVGAADVAPV